MKPETGSQPDTEPHDPDRPASWGPWLFGVTLVLVVVFFWWLLIYSHGVAPHA